MSFVSANNYGQIYTRNKKNLKRIFIPYDVLWNSLWDSGTNCYLDLYVSRVRTQLTKVKIAISVRGRRTEARGTSIHNTSYEMTIHLRSYFYTASKALLNQFDQRDMYSV